MKTQRKKESKLQKETTIFVDRPLPSDAPHCVLPVSYFERLETDALSTGRRVLTVEQWRIPVGINSDTTVR